MLHVRPDDHHDSSADQKTDTYPPFGFLRHEYEAESNVDKVDQRWEFNPESLENDAKVFQSFHRNSYALWLGMNCRLWSW